MLYVITVKYLVWDWQKWGYHSISATVDAADCAQGHNDSDERSGRSNWYPLVTVQTPPRRANHPISAKSKHPFLMQTNTLNSTHAFDSWMSDKNRVLIENVICVAWKCTSHHLPSTLKRSLFKRILFLSPFNSSPPSPLWRRTRKIKHILRSNKLHHASAFPHTEDV